MAARVGFSWTRRRPDTGKLRREGRRDVLIPDHDVHEGGELYEKVFYRWSIHNADHLSAGEVPKAGIQHIAEEIR
jgi:hypothetical protein